MKYVGNAVIILFSLCLAILIGTDSVGIGFYIVLIAAEYGIVLLLNADFRKATKKFFMRKGTFGQENKHYGEVHLETIQEDIEKMEADAFTYFISDLFKVLGYKTKMPEGIEAFGGDIVAKRGKATTLINLKHCSSISENIGNEVVQQAVAAMPMYKANESMVITNGEFTEQAYEQAHYNHTIMIDGKQLFNLVRQAIEQNKKASNGKAKTVEDAQMITKEAVDDIKMSDEMRQEADEITKEDCLNEQVESVLADTIPEVTLESELEVPETEETKVSEHKVANGKQGKSE